MRNLKDTNGATLQAPSWFAKLRDKSRFRRPSSRRRRATTRSSSRSSKAGIKRKEPLRGVGLHGRQPPEPHLADAARSATTPSAPISATPTSPTASRRAARRPSRSTSDQPNPATGIAREVTGTFTGALLPERHQLFATPSGTTDGGGFNYSSSAPDATPTREAGQHGDGAVRLHHPDLGQRGLARARVAVRPRAPRLGGRGRRRERRGHGGRAQLRCSAPPTGGGSPSADIPFDIAALQDLNKFPAVVDRLQQGVLNTLYPRPPDEELERLRLRSGVPAERPVRCSTPPTLYYDGNSQGGIMGGMTTAVAPDYTRAVLGVTGMDYGGLLLQRSTDFAAYASFLYGNARQRRLHRRLDPSADPRPDAAALGSRRGGRLRAST